MNNELNLFKQSLKSFLRFPNKIKMTKLKSESAKIHSSLMKDINRIRKTAEMQTRMNILRKHQIKLLNKFIEKLIKDGRITKEELKKYMPKKKQAERELFEKI